MAIEKALVCFDPEKLRTMIIFEKASKDQRKAKQQPLSSKGHLPSAIDHNLLEELFEDYVFLKGLMDDEVFLRAGNGDIKCLVENGMSFLDKRIDYWRNRNPKGEADGTVLEEVSHSLLTRQEPFSKKHRILPSIAFGHRASV